MSDTFSPILAASPQTLWFYADANNQPAGPISFEELKRLATAGVIQPETNVIEEGGNAWRALKEVLPPLPKSIAGDPRRWPTILALFFFYPLGAWLLWRSNAFERHIKKSVLYICTPLFVLGIGLHKPGMIAALFFALVLIWVLQTMRLSKFSKVVIGSVAVPLLLPLMFMSEDTKTGSNVDPAPPPALSNKPIEQRIAVPAQNATVASTQNVQSLPYEILQVKETGNDEPTINAEITPEQGRLPDDNQIRMVAQRIVDEKYGRNKNKQCHLRLYLPGQVIGAAYALVDFKPGLQVSINKFVIDHNEAVAHRDTKEGAVKNQVIRAVNKCVLGGPFKDVQITSEVEGGVGPLFDIHITYFFRKTQQRSVAEVKASIEGDMRSAYERLYTSGAPIRDTVISATMYLPDKYGNESDVVVYETQLDAPTAKKINWGNSSMVNFLHIWRTRVLHADFQE